MSSAKRYMNRCCMCFSLLLVYTSFLVACQQQTDVVQSTLSEKNRPAKQISSLHSAASAVFDIPVLLQLSIPQVKAKLGTPLEELQANAANTERSLVYKKGGLILSVYYILDTPNVEVISLTNERDTTAFRYLLPLGNISPSINTYRIDTLFGQKPGLYRGIAVRINPSVETQAAP